MKKTILPLLLLTSSLCFGQVDLNLGLRAYYPFTGNANDVSGNNNNPVFNNATLTADRLGNPNSAYHFNGTDTYIRVPNNTTLNMNNKISLCAWVKPMGFYTGNCANNAMIMKLNSDNQPGNYSLRFNPWVTGCTSFPDYNNEQFGAVVGQGGSLNGGAVAFSSPPIQLNQWYSVVYTNDGIMGRIYINCIPYDSTPVTSLYNFTNVEDLFLGHLNSSAFPYWLNGDLDEIRIYDRALTVDEVNVLGGCSITAPGISNIINDYTPVPALNVCTNKLTVEDATKFNPGDTVLLIQMKGAIIDSTNTASFGIITDYRNAGNYEFNYVKTKTGNVIELDRRLSRQYDVPTGKVQLVRVPYYTDVNVSDTLTCLPWDGSKGGVLVFNVLNKLTLNANIDVSGKGFKGAPGYNPQTTTLNCSRNEFNYPLNSPDAAQKGESITTISNNIISGKGSPAGGGGGGLGHNSGGGGGGNGGTGGFGGYQLEACGGPPFDNRGNGGKSLNYSSATNKIFMGGGGGAGHAENAGNLPPAGGNGAGIIIISANQILSNSKKIIANGNPGLACTVGGPNNCHDGMGGGGAGGTVLLFVNQFTGNANIETKGGKGADMTGSVPVGGRIGAGGGGSGGATFLKNASLPPAVTINNAGGLNGVLTTDGNNSWGATPGAAGVNLFNLSLPLSATAFQINIDSVRIKDSLVICRTYDFKGLAYTNTNPITNWQWHFGDGSTANTQNSTHTYNVTGNYLIKLVVTDINGCKDSIIKPVNIIVFTADAGNDTTLCSANPKPVILHASAGITYAWTPALFLNDSTLQNPIATITGTTRFYVTVTNAQGCTATDSVIILLSVPPVNIRYPDLTALINQSVQLQGRNLGGNSYQWLPPTGLNNSLIINPLFNYNQSQEFKIHIATADGCSVVDTLLVKVSGKKGIYVPKAFSPNGDGANDRLYPILVGIAKLNYFRVYNRWGNLVFETNSGNPSLGWDGKVKGLSQPPETFTWTVEGIDVDGILIRKSGNTFLIR